jgi:hypothetical protein
LIKKIASELKKKESDVSIIFAGKLIVSNATIESSEIFEHEYAAVRLPPTISVT